jgi:hypothetical protein
MGEFSSGLGQILHKIVEIFKLPDDRMSLHA